MVPKSDNWSQFVVVEVVPKKHLVVRFPPSKKQYDVIFVEGTHTQFWSEMRKNGHSPQNDFESLVLLGG